MDLHNSILEIHNSIMDFHDSNIEIHKSLVFIDGHYSYVWISTIRILEIHNYLRRSISNYASP